MKNYNMKFNKLSVTTSSGCKYTVDGEVFLDLFGNKRVDIHRVYVDDVERIFLLDTHKETLMIEDEIIKVLAVN